jgi:hypothetical protein
MCHLRENHRCAQSIGEVKGPTSKLRYAIISRQQHPPIDRVFPRVESPKDFLRNCAIVGADDLGNILKEHDLGPELLNIVKECPDQAVPWVMKEAADRWHILGESLARRAPDETVKLSPLNPDLLPNC